MKKSLSALPLVLCLAATGLSAQTLTDIKIDPAQPLAGQTVTVSVNLEAGDNANCGVRFYWGDGATSDIKVNDKAAIPYKLTHTYAKAGEYRTMAEGKKVTTHLKCMGKNIVQMLTVAAPKPVAPVAAAPVAAPAQTSGPACPEGWKLTAKSVNKKTGAYNCTAKAGTALPAAKPACPGDLTYFENSKKGQLGCRP